MLRLSFLFLLLLSVSLTASELGAVVAPLEEPTIERAKKVLGDLDRMIARGDARTVTLATKMRRSIRRIFTHEHKIQQARTEADRKEEKAKQLDQNREDWLKPNAFGRVNKLAAEAALQQAREIRQRLAWQQEALSKEWQEEVADFERMLGDLEFSKEGEALLTLSETLNALVKRVPWVDPPDMSYGPERVRILRVQVPNRDRWLLLARHAAEARDFGLSYDFFRKAGDDEGRRQVGRKLAEQLAEEGFPGSAINQWRRVGEEERAATLLEKTPEPTAVHFKVLDPAALSRNAAPACVRILTPGGTQTGFFVEPGGYLLTCKSGLEKKGESKGGIKVALSDGRVLPAQIRQRSKEADLVLLKIEHEGHEFLPLGRGGDLKEGGAAFLFGYPDGEAFLPTSTRGTVLKAGEEWQGQKVTRLALDGTPGQRGAPLVDHRGRVVGMFLNSQTGTARALKVSPMRELLKGL